MGQSSKIDAIVSVHRGLSGHLPHLLLKGLPLPVRHPPVHHRYHLEFSRRFCRLFRGDGPHAQPSPAPGADQRFASSAFVDGTDAPVGVSASMAGRDDHGSSCIIGVPCSGSGGATTRSTNRLSSKYRASSPGSAAILRP